MSAPTRGRLRRSARRSLPLLAALATLAVSSHAAAEELPVTAQARAANAQWLAYAPPPSGGARALCVVDTGLTLNPDLASAVVGRAALDGGTIEDVDPRRHGSAMAMIAAAAPNGTGMVGAWPAIRLRSVRAAAPPGTGPAQFAFTDYARAIRVCQSSPDVAAIVLALGGAQPASESETDTFVNYVVQAHAWNVNVVAAAGNNGGAVTTPASLPGVLAVGAGDAAGALCSFSSRGAGLDLLAPGCGLDTADPVTLERLVGAGGSSQASVFAAAALVALRSYRPDLSWHQAEDLLRATAAAGVLDLAAAFRAAGLATVVDAGAAAIPAAPTAQPMTGAPAAIERPAGEPRKLRRFASPHVRARCRAGRVAVRIARRPRDALALVRLVARRGGRMRELARRRTARQLVTVRVRRCPARVSVRFVDRYGEQAFRSRATVVAVRRIGRR